MGNLLKHRLLGSTPTASDLVSLEWWLGIHISHKFLGDTDAAVQGMEMGPVSHNVYGQLISKQNQGFANKMQSGESLAQWYS